MSKKIAILVSNTFEDYINSLEAEDFFHSYTQVFFKVLKKYGFEIELVCFNDPIPDEKWKSYKSILLNLAWDYHLNRDAFINTLKTINKKGVPLYNSYKTVFWNSNKTYLIDLKNNGIKVPETIYTTPAENPNIKNLVREKGIKSCILKPSISAAAYKTYMADSISEAQDIYSKNYLNEQLVMIQAIIDEIISEGEWSFMFFNGIYSHNVLKTTNPGGFKVQYTWDHTKYDIAEPWMIKNATTTLETVQKIIGEIPLYARIDCAKRNHELIVTEIELIEPYLYLYTEDAFEKYVSALNTKIHERDKAKILALST